MALIPPARVLPRRRILKGPSRFTQNAPGNGGVLLSPMNRATVPDVMEDDEERDGHALRAAGAIVRLPHISAFDVHEDTALARFPDTEINLVIDCSPICICECHCEEVALACLCAAECGQLRDNVGQLPGKGPPPHVEKPRAAVEVIAKRRVMRCLIFRKAFGEAVMAESDVDAEAFGRILPLYRAFIRDGV